MPVADALKARMEAVRRWWNEPEAPQLALGHHAAGLARASWWSLAVGLLTAAVAVLVFDWQHDDVLRGLLLGGAGWTVVWLARERDRLLPGVLPDAPADAEIRAPDALSLWGEAWDLVKLAPLILVLAWIADISEVGPYVVPGRFFGYAAGGWISAALARRWEREQEATLLSDDDDNLYRLTDAPPSRPTAAIEPAPS